MSKLHPTPLFDTLSHLNGPISPDTRDFLNRINLTGSEQEYHLTCLFLNSYAGSQDTFNTYRREVERLLQWAWTIKIKPLKHLDRHDITEYLAFAQKPPTDWIGTKQCARFLTRSGTRIVNPDWRPFVIRIPKAQRKFNPLAEIKQYRMNNQSLTSLFAVLSTFYTFLQQEEYVSSNPIIQIRQKGQYLQKNQAQRVTRRLTPIQWHFVIETTQQLANTDSNFERHLFLLSAFYLLGLRISEMAETPGRVPQMCDFSPDKNSRWWFSTVGKGNKLREVAVPDTLLSALKRFRLHLGLSPLPTRSEATPILPKLRGSGGLGTRQVRNLVQTCFDKAIEKLQAAGRLDDAQDLATATVHWLRHTSISVDVEYRPREHVRDDAGHENITITDRYIEIDRIARHESAKDKPLMTDK